MPGRDGVCFMRIRHFHLDGDTWKTEIEAATLNARILSTGDEHHVEHFERIEPEPPKVCPLPKPKRPKSPCAEKAQRNWKRAFAWLKAGAPDPLPRSVLDHRHACCTGRTLEGVRVSGLCPYARKRRGRIECGGCCSCREGGNWFRVDPKDPTVPHLSTPIACPDFDCPQRRFVRLTASQT